MKTHFIILLLLSPIVNSCICYNKYIDEVTHTGFNRYGDYDWRQFAMDVKYKEIDKNKLLEHTKTWLESNFYYKDKSLNAFDENLSKSDKIIEIYDEENYTIVINGIRKDDLDRIYQCKVLVDILDDKVKVLYHDFIMFEKYSREPYILKNGCTFFKIRNDLRDLTNTFFYTKFN